MRFVFIQAEASIAYHATKAVLSGKLTRSANRRT